MTRPLLAVWLCGAVLLTAHEQNQGVRPPTKAKAALDAAAAHLKAARKQLSATGKYSCCVRPGCSLCPLSKGACSCARSAKAGQGMCGECYAGWKAGRGALRGVAPSTVTLCPVTPPRGQHPKADAAIAAEPELVHACKNVAEAKATLVAEKRYACCIRGGCHQCAQEAACPCARDLAADVIAPQSQRKRGVCGECLDGWKAGQGRLPGIAPTEVTLAPMESMDPAMGPGGNQAAMYASGTSQTPSAGPMPMLTRTFGPWRLSLHGVAFGLYSANTGPRGEDQAFSTNWLMPTLSRRLGPGTLSIRSMLSLEPATITGRRYPLLFQEGETAYGIPLVNGQHPHDFFMELAALYQVPLTERTTFHLYGGPRGEPALGPPAYPHRLSASENPVAALGHHDQDSTHISTDVVTAGLTYRALTLEASGFHGREPDEFRWGLEQGAIDSFSTRLTITPTPRWSGQVSAGRLNHAEAIHPLRPSFRTTASLMYVRPLASGHWASTLVWGRHEELSYTQQPGIPVLPQEATTPPPQRVFRPLHVVTVPTRIPAYTYNSYLAESTLFFKRKHWLWGRAENLDRDSLLLFEQSPLLLLVDEQRYTRVQAYTAGYEYELPRRVPGLSTGLGGQFTLFHAPPNLAPFYNANPTGVQVFLRMRLATRTGS